MFVTKELSTSHTSQRECQLTVQPKHRDQWTLAQWVSLGKQVETFFWGGSARLWGIKNRALPGARIQSNKAVSLMFRHLLSQDRMTCLQNTTSTERYMVGSDTASLAPDAAILTYPSIYVLFLPFVSCILIFSTPSPHKHIDLTRAHMLLPMKFV